MKTKCVICGKEIREKNVLGINKKLLGEDIINFYCMDCLADYLDVTVDDLNEKIEEFKQEAQDEIQLKLNV